MITDINELNHKVKQLTTRPACKNCKHSQPHDEYFVECFYKYNLFKNAGLRKLEPSKEICNFYKHGDSFNRLPIEYLVNRFSDLSGLPVDELMANVNHSNGTSQYKILFTYFLYTSGCTKEEISEYCGTPKSTIDKRIHEVMYPYNNQCMPIFKKYEPKRKLAV